MARIDATTQRLPERDESIGRLVEELRHFPQRIERVERPGYFENQLRAYGAATLTWALSQAHPDGLLEVVESVREAPCLTRPFSGPLESLGLIACGPDDEERVDELAAALRDAPLSVSRLDGECLADPSPEALASLARRGAGLDAVIAPLTPHRALPYALLLARLLGKATITVAPSHDHPLNEGLAALPRLLVPATLSLAVWVRSAGSLAFWQEVTHGRALGVGAIHDCQALMDETRQVCAAPFEIVVASEGGTSNAMPLMAALLRASLGKARLSGARLGEKGLDETGIGKPRLSGARLGEALRRSMG